MQHINLYTSLLLLIRLGSVLAAESARVEFSSHDALMSALEMQKNAYGDHENKARAVSIMRRVKRAPYAGCRCRNGQWEGCACDHPYTFAACDFKIAGQTLSAAEMVHYNTSSDEPLFIYLTHYLLSFLLICSIYGRLSWP